MRMLKLAIGKLDLISSIQFNIFSYLKCPVQIKIFICSFRVLADTVDAYDVMSDTWETITHVPTPRYHAGIVGVESKIYFIGGFLSDALFDRATGI